jgi:RimJ/RimL family protein N-acetyltransferase
LLLLGWDVAVAEWVGRHLNIPDFGPCTAIGIVHDDALIGGVVYNHFMPPIGIEMTIATESPRWLSSRGVLRALFSYPYLQLNCARITATTESTNKRAISMLGRLGFVQEGCLRRGFPGADAVIYGMLTEECRWLGNDRNAKTPDPDRR